MLLVVLKELECGRCCFTRKNHNKHIIIHWLNSHNWDVSVLDVQLCLVRKLQILSVLVDRFEETMAPSTDFMLCVRSKFKS